MNNGHNSSTDGGSALAKTIKEGASRIGYSECGIAVADHFSGYTEALDAILERFPELKPLYEPMRNRATPLNRAPWAGAVVVCLRRYGKYRLPGSGVGHIGRNYLCDRRYEGNSDHDMNKRMTEFLKSLGLRVAGGGTADRWAAVRAGIAKIGCNCFAYSDRHGSWVNIETWLVDAVLPADTPTIESPCPPGCNACVTACPTGAIVEPFMMRMDRCVAWLTYSAPEPIDPALEDRMGEWVYGCDVCQQVCPLNKGKWEEVEDMPWMDGVKDLLSPEALANMDEKTYHDLVHVLFWYIPKENLARWHRNAKRAIRNKNKREKAS